MTTPNDIASQWFDSVGADLQDYQVPPAPEPEPDLDNPLADEPEPDPDRPFADTPEVTNDDLRNIQNLRAVSRPTAEVIVGTMDVLLPAAGAILLKGSDKDDLRLSDTEHDTLVEAWSAYLAGKSVQVSPGAALVLAILTIYGAKVATAVNNRLCGDDFAIGSFLVRRCEDQNSFTAPAARTFLLHLSYLLLHHLLQILEEYWIQMNGFY